MSISNTFLVLLIDTQRSRDKNLSRLPNSGRTTVASRKAATKETKRDRLVALVREHPGLNSHELACFGWRSQRHGSLRDAMLDSAIEWRDGWYVVEGGAQRRA